MQNQAKKPTGKFSWAFLAQSCRLDEKNPTLLRFQIQQRKGKRKLSCGYSTCQEQRDRITLNDIESIAGGLQMGISTVFPEMVMSIAEAVTEAVEPRENQDLTEEDIREIAAACRETRAKFNSMAKMLQEHLGHGVEAAKFLQQAEPRLARLDRLILQYSANLAKVEQFQAASSGSHGSSVMRELTSDLESLGKAMSLVRDMLREAVSKMKTPHRPLDWQRVQQAQEAFRKGDTASVDKIANSSCE